MTDEEYEKWIELTDKMIGDLPFDNEMTHIDGIVDFRDELLMYFKQRQEVVPHNTVVMWRKFKDGKPPKKGWYLVATDDEWRRDFWDGKRWYWQRNSKYTKYWAEVVPPKAT